MKYCLKDKHIKQYWEGIQMEKRYRLYLIIGVIVVTIIAYVIALWGIK